MSMAYSRSATRSSVCGTIGVAQSRQRHKTKATAATDSRLRSLRSPEIEADTGSGESVTESTDRVELSVLSILSCDPFRSRGQARDPRQAARDAARASRLIVVRERHYMNGAVGTVGRC